MLRKGANRERVLEVLHDTSRSELARVSRETGVPEADVYGVGSFYTLVSDKKATRVCQGLSCWMAGSDQVLTDMKAKGEEALAVSCVGQCDRAPAWLDLELAAQSEVPQGAVTPDDPELPMNLGGADTTEYAGLARALEIGVDAVLDALDASGLQGRGGAAFPAGRKWRAVREQAETERYVVCNADESEPGTFKDRDLMRLRPHLLLEGLAIAARAAETTEIYIYIRGEFVAEQRALEAAIAEVKDGPLAGLNVTIIMGHGAYICGEETAMLEAMEGKRGMPRLKPPYPTVVGFRGKPTLINNVETLACVPAIVLRGGKWFKALGKTEPGTKLYCLSGHVKNPGVYELPLGVSLDELVAAGGGYVGTPVAFSPGGASSGFLPIAQRTTPLDFKSLAEAGSMLGSAGVVVLNDTVDMVLAARNQAVFFEDESCGQCAPCRIGTQLLTHAIDRHVNGQADALSCVEDLSWEMEEGSICGLGMVAFLPIQTAMKHFPTAFASEAE
jgi:NADH:ubiquinone oxidoreductase subunit F (NADH-binding)